MPRFFPFSTPTCSSRFRSVRVAPFLLAVAVCVSPAARADEFSALAPNDPIAIQLALISPATTRDAGAPASTASASASLTRYEAALQTARVILDVQNREAGTVSRVQWRAIVALCGSLKSELRQLGVDVEGARALANKNLKAGDLSAGGFKSRAAKTGDKAGEKSSLARNPSFLAPGLVSPLIKGVSTGRAPGSGTLEMQLMPRMRVATDVARIGSAGADATATDSERASRFAPGGAAAVAAEGIASQTALSYDLSHYLTLRAANSRLNWNGAAGGGDGNPLLGAPLFAGARGASGTGGGVDLKLGSGLKFSTEVERLRADTGALASRIGGGASLSAFSDRLSLQMSLSRLLSGERGALPATAAQASASLDVTPRLSLNVRYQGLFAPTPSSSASRVAGGVSLSF